MNWFPCQTSVSFGSSMWTTDSGTKTASLWKVPHLCKHGSCLQITALLSFLESNTAGSFQNSHGSQFWQIAVCSVYKNAAACNTKQRFWSKLYWGRKKFKGKMHTLHVLGYTPLFTCWKHWHYLHGANISCQNWLPREFEKTVCENFLSRYLYLSGQRAGLPRPITPAHNIIKTFRKKS